MNFVEKINSMSIPSILCPFGKELKTKEDFEAAKPAIKKLLCDEEYGVIPEKPDSISVEVISSDPRFCASKATYTKYMLTAKIGDEEVKFPFYSAIPNKEGKIPAFVHINFDNLMPAKYQPTEEIIDRGYAVFTIFYKEVTSDDGDFEDGIAKVLVKDRTAPNATGKIALWAWSIMRVIDYIETLAFYDENALAVIGHSRLGKTTLLTAAFDERVKFACANDSGTSGDAIARQTRGESIKAITDRFPFWFCPNYLKYQDKEDEQPFDQHFLLSLIVPRAILNGSAEQDVWADPYNQFISAALVKDVYKLYGMEGLVFSEDIPEAPVVLQDGDASFHTRLGTHYLGREDWNIYMNFIDKKLGR